MKFEVVLSRDSVKDLEKIDEDNKERIFKALLIIGNEPFYGKKLVGKLKGLYSIRVWPYRIIYKIDKIEKLILVISIRHRQSAYGK